MNANRIDTIIRIFTTRMSRRGALSRSAVIAVIAALVTPYPLPVPTRTK